MTILCFCDYYGAPVVGFWGPECPRCGLPCLISRDAWVRQYVPGLLEAQVRAVLAEDDDVNERHG